MRSTLFTIAGVVLSFTLSLPGQSKLPEGKGKPLVERECGKCHGLENVVSARMSRERWSDLVDDMVSRGAAGTDQEIDQIIDYLATNFGKTAVNAKPAATAKINVNHAGAADLVSGLEISEQDASAIVRYREQNGNFKDLEELKKVPGIDAKRLDDKKDRLEFVVLWGGLSSRSRVSAGRSSDLQLRKGESIMLATSTSVAPVSFYIDGKWERPTGRTTGLVVNPATGSTIAEVPYADDSDVDRAVRAAHEAFLKWREVPVVDRVQVLYRYKALLEKHAADVAAILTRENGKTADDAKMPKCAAPSRWWKWPAACPA